MFDDQLPVVMTEKDAVRCKGMNLKNLWYLKVEAGIDEEFLEKIVNRIKMRDLNE
jgi:tetraacyldisaccharide 4'-kinase